MNDKQRLDQWIAKLEEGDRSLDELLVDIPEVSVEERALLKAAARVKRIRNLEAAPSYKESTRRELVGFMREHPRKQEQAGQRSALFPRLMRFGAVAVSLVLAVLVTGTALAQSARPGDRFYPWKLASERAYQTLHPDPTAAEVQIARRRVREMLAADNPQEREISLDGYQQALEQLSTGLQPAEKEIVLNTLRQQQSELQAANLDVPRLDRTIRDLSGAGDREEGEKGPLPTDLPEAEQESGPDLLPTEDSLKEAPVLELPTVTVDPEVEGDDTGGILPEN